MTAEEFTAEAERLLAPPIERLIQMAFETTPADNVENLVVASLDLMARAAVRAVHRMIAEQRN